jgi:Mrp family chromosome partitioning ATPase
MQTLIKALLEKYDHVVVDAPPILALADAPLLSRAVEGCVLVVEAEGAPLRAVKAAVQRLTGLHAHIFGVVLTKLKHRKGEDAYGYGYGYGYGFGYGYGAGSTDAAKDR